MDPSPSTWKPRSVLSRYAPALAVLVALLVLMMVEPRAGSSGSAVPQPIGGAGVAPGSSVDGDDAAANPAGVSTVEGDASTPGSDTAGPASSGGGHAATQRVDGLGRPLEGDRSKCASDGLRQQDVLAASYPCIPKLDGDNGGATYQGVTADTITIVAVILKPDPAVDAALSAYGLSASPEQHAEINELFEKFFNKHLELYGRKLDIVTYVNDCESLGDPACYRVMAKRINEKHRPFAVNCFAPPWCTRSFNDQLSALGVINTPVMAVASKYFTDNRPYVWNFYPSGGEIANIVGDYYCKKLTGKRAAYAGSADLQVRTRRLGIVTYEDPYWLEQADQLRGNTAGGMCGSAADGTQIYTLSSDRAAAQNEMPTLVTRMKNDGVTTINWMYAAPGCNECSKQNYYPEHLLTPTGSADADVVGRFSNAQSPGQWDHAFGPGAEAQARTKEHYDFYKAIKDVSPDYDAPAIAAAPWNGLSMLANLIQLAGPNLTPFTFEAGAHSAPQLGGWSSPTAFPGWKCCDPFVQEIKFGPGDYTAVSDFRLVYFDSTAPSPNDGQPGAYRCLDDCRRYEVGQIPSGEPRPPV